MSANRSAENFSVVFQNSYSRIVAYFERRLPGDPMSAEDLVAEVFEVLWRRFEELPAPPDDLHWLFGIARHFYQSKRTSRLATKLRTFATDQSFGSSGTDVATSVANVLVVREAMNRLSPLDAEMLRLVYWDGLSHEDAASVLGCTCTVLRKRLSRARERLRKELDLAIPHRIIQEKVRSMTHLLGRAENPRCLSGLDTISMVILK